MRIKAIVSVFPRKLPSGRRVYYYQCYDQKDKRQWAKSTGLSKKTEAMKYCIGLHKEGLLIPVPKVPTFGEFSEGWWDLKTCRYLKWRQLHDPITEGTIIAHKGHFENHILKYFDKFRLDEITPVAVENWLVSMSEKKMVKNMAEEKKTVLKPKTITHALSTLRLMMGEAARQKIIKENPCLAVKELKEEYIEREILTKEEVKKIFPANWSAVWKREIHYIANLLAACTGMRLGELRGLRCEYVFDDYIYVCGQYSRHGYKDYTKTKENRNIPISTIMREMLEELMQLNAGGYLFSKDGGKTPLTEDSIRLQFENALKKIGIDEAERMRRNLTFHAWRHFLNTLLRMNNVADSKVQKVTGHKTRKMTEHYTHFDTRQFTEVRQVQTNLLTFNEPEKTETKIIFNGAVEEMEIEDVKDTDTLHKPVKKITKKAVVSAKRKQAMKPKPQTAGKKKQPVKKAAGKQRKRA